MKGQKIQLSDHFTYKKLLLFTAPSIAMMIFTSIYGVVDGFFVSNFAGKTPFAALNFIYPVLMVLGAIGSMLGTGGSALIAKTIGEGKKKEANELFSLLIYLTIGIGTVLAVIAYIMMPSIARWLGAGDLLDDCVVYARVCLLAMPAFMLQFEFQSLLATAEKPTIGLGVTVAAGITNIVLDAVLVTILPQEHKLAGAAMATALSQYVGGVLPIIYFARKNTSLLRLGRPRFDGRAILRTCSNGSSEFLSNISASVVSLLYNIQLKTYAGDDGIAAYGVMMYVSLVFVAVFIGYALGSAPIISYHYGAGNKSELQSIFRKSIKLILIASVAMLALSEGLSYPLSSIFVGYDTELLDMTHSGFLIFSFSFLFSGIPIFASSFFTALNNGPISAAISFMRTLIFQIGAVLLLPMIFGLTGIWLSIVVADIAAAITAVIFLIIKKKKYGY